MPIFDFRCKKCGFIEEFILRASDPLPRRCSKCGGPLKKLMPKSVGIAFKGPGFYVTDSRKTSSAAPGSNPPPPKGGEAKPVPPADAAKALAKGGLKTKRPGP